MSTSVGTLGAQVRKLAFKSFFGLFCFDGVQNMSVELCIPSWDMSNLFRGARHAHSRCLASSSVG